MSVAMVEIRVMRMAVDEVAVTVRVAVRLPGRIVRIVGMRMMFIVGMEMFML